MMALLLALWNFSPADNPTDFYGRLNCRRPGVIAVYHRDIDKLVYLRGNDWLIPNMAPDGAITDKNCIAA